MDEESRQDFDTGRRKVYLGLPVTSVAGILPLLMGLGRWLHWPLRSIAPAVLLLVAAAFLTPFSVRKPSLSVKRKPRLHGGRRRRKQRQGR